MLPLPDLDDRFFKQIVEESKKMIPKFAPQWTDENYHDPGITFIELFAWLAEMQQYYLNQITVKNELKFLKLMGRIPREAVPARADVTFEGVPNEIYLPKGTRLAAGNQTFETEEPLLLVSAQIEKVIAFSDSDSIDYSSPNRNKNVTYLAFGRDAKKGNRLYIGFDRELPLCRNLCLTLNLHEKYPVRRGSSENCKAELIPSARVSWSYYGSGTGRKAKPAWLPLQVVGDDTVQLSCSGRITFQIPTQMRQGKIHPANDKSRCWICCTVEEGGYELPPKLEQILLNTISAVQRKTLSELVSFPSSGQPGMFIDSSKHLPLYGLNKVQVQTENGYWRYWKEVKDLSAAEASDPFYILDRNMAEKKVTVRFGDGKHGMLPPTGQDKIRLISYLPSFQVERLLGMSNGLPGQLFQMHNLPVFAQSFRLQVGVRIPGFKEYLWQDWVRVDDFEASKPGDRHYMINGETGEILFGDNEKGIIPEAAASTNLCIISCQTGGGDLGNVKENEINIIVDKTDELQAIKVTNHFSATGGTERETIEDAKRSVRRELKKQYRAVTAEDFEEIAKATPGLRVARVKAIPLFEKGLKDYPQNKAPAQVTVAVLPYSESKKPVPSKGFIETIKRHLDNFRLITTEVHVIPPEYIKITVHAVIVVTSDLKFDPEKILLALERLLHPLDNPDGSKGWPFGRTVYKGDIYGAINRIDKVEFIKDLWLDAEGTGIRKTQSGDIKIPPYGLAYSGEHEIEIVSRSDL